VPGWNCSGRAPLRSGAEGTHGLLDEEARVDVTVAVTGAGPDDELRSLCSWLAGDDDLAGLVEPTVTPTPRVPQGQLDGQIDGQPDGMDQRSDTVTVRLDPPGAATALANSLVAWIRDHSHDAIYEVARPDGVSVRVSARRVRQTSGAVVRELVTELCRSPDLVGSIDQLGLTDQVVPVDPIGSVDRS